MNKVAIIIALILTTPALASYWTITKNERDPFDKEHSTFVAITTENGNSLAVRCLEGDISFAVSLPAGSLERGDEVQFKIAADEKDPTDDTGSVISSNVMIALVQFGSIRTLDFIRHSKKFWLRASGSDSHVTLAFTGGKSFDDALSRAEKACGLAPEDDPVKPSPTAPAAPKPSARWANKDCSRETSCSNQFSCLSDKGELGDKPDNDGFSTWCKAQPGMKP